MFILILFLRFIIRIINYKKMSKVNYYKILIGKKNSG